MRVQQRSPAAGGDRASEGVVESDFVGPSTDRAPPSQIQRPSDDFCRPIGEVAVDLVADLHFRRQVEQLCEKPRLAAELLAEVAAEHSTRAEIERKPDHYLSLDRATLAALRADRFPPVPLHRVPE